jgi:hypothetical protein
MGIDPSESRYFLRVRICRRADRVVYFCRIWENLDNPWLVREIGPYMTDGKAMEAGEIELRHLLLDGASH